VALVVRGLETQGGFVIVCIRKEETSEVVEVGDALRGGI
jgi:hypothetical protein